MSMPKASEALTDLLNRAVASELGAIIQYMWQHITMAGLEAESVGDAVRDISRAEMGHAERIAERLNYFGGIPTVKPDPIYVGGEIPAMLKVNITTEEAAIALYMDIVRQATEDGDEETALMFKQIILDEQDHHNTYLTLLGIKNEAAEPRIGD
jgi:bacterioferritin